MLGAKPLTDNEISTIVQRLPLRDRTLFIFKLYTGFRVEEALSLRVSDVMDASGIFPRVRVERRNMKGGRASRTVILHEKAKNALIELIDGLDLDADDYLFTGRKGGPISRVQAWRMLKGVVRAAGLSERISLHSTRKTFADKIYTKSGKDLVVTSKALGHKSVLSTVSYLSFRTEEIDELITE